MNDLFIDTGAFLARYLKNDSLHEKSLKTWKKIEKSRLRLITSSYVINELASLLSKRAGPVFAVARLRAIYNSVFFTIIHSNLLNDHRALDTMEEYSDLPLSFTDASSIILMKEYGIEHIFSYDNDFRIVGLGIFE